jgi:hypothetical protein
MKVRRKIQASNDVQQVINNGVRGRQLMRRREYGEHGNNDKIYDIRDLRNLADICMYCRSSLIQIELGD